MSRPLNEGAIVEERKKVVYTKKGTKVTDEKKVNKIEEKAKEEEKKELATSQVKTQYIVTMNYIDSYGIKHAEGEVFQAPLSKRITEFLSAGILRKYDEVKAEEEKKENEKLEILKKEIKDLEKILEEKKKKIS